MKQNKGSDYSELLIWAAALVTVVRYAAAFIASDATEIGATLSLIITYAMGLSGLGMGILDVIGGAYLFTGWQRKMPKNGDAWSFRFKVLSFFAVGLIVNGILILIPFTMSRVAGVSVHHILGDGVLLFGWSAVVNIAPYLLIGGVAVGNQIVTVDSGQMTGQLSELSERKTDNERTVTVQRKSKRELTAADYKRIAAMPTAQIVTEYDCDERTARRWRKAAQETPAPPFPMNHE